MKTIATMTRRAVESPRFEALCTFLSVVALVGLTVAGSMWLSEAAPSFDDLLSMSHPMGRRHH